MEACYACVVRCKKVVEVKEPSLTVDPAYGGPEYETLASLGSTCGVEDLKAIAKGNELCGAYTLDTISAGVAVAWHHIADLLIDHLHAILAPAVISKRLDGPIQRGTRILLPARSPYLGVLHDIHRHRHRIDLRRPTSP